MPGLRNAADLKRDLAQCRTEGELDLHPSGLMAAVPRARRQASRLLLGLWQRGELVRLGTGVYFPAPRWRELPAWDRHRLAAVALSWKRPQAVFTGPSAAHLHGLPLVDTPSTLHVRAAYRGHTGRRPLSAAHAGPGAERLPAPPDVTPRWNAWTVDSLSPVRVPVVSSAGEGFGSVLADPLPTVQLTLGATLALTRALPPLDALARRHPVPAQRWAETHAVSLPSAAARARFQAAWELADPRSESAGESLSRALIHERGFVAPELQQPFFEPSGAFVGRADFWWPGAGVVGEFDGITKYDVDFYAGEAERRAALRAEKDREVRLRRLVREVVRWTWDDLRDPSRLEAELLRHGVPRRAG